MAITTVGATTATAEGEFGSTLTNLEIDTPAGLAAGDCLHLAIGFPKHQFYGLFGLTFQLLRQYGISVPTGWRVVYSDAWQDGTAGTRNHRIIILRRFATGTEGASIIVPITRTVFRADFPPEDEVVQVVGALVAHRGVSLSTPVNAGYTTVRIGDVSWGRVTTEDSVLVQLAASFGYPEAPGGTFPAYPDPLTTAGEPAAWDVLDQETTTGVDTAGVYRTPTTSRENIVARIAALETGSFTLNTPLRSGQAPYLTGVIDNRTRALRVFFALTDATRGPLVDEPPPPGILGLTGSGSLTPEWLGRDRVILEPLRTSVWTVQPGAYGDELAELVPEGLAPECVALEATFNGLGACLTAQATFPGPPGFTPYGQVVRFGITLATDEYEISTVWWSGVVQNIRYDNGLYNVELVGLWYLLNDARIALDSGGDVDRPALPGIIWDTLVLGVGDPTAVVLETPADEQQTWGEHYNNVFRAFPRAAWGVGPDFTFVQGLPEQGGVIDLDAETNESVTRVSADAFVLPPYATEWYAVLGDQTVVSAQLTPAPGPLVPARLIQSRVDESNNLLEPKEASFPIFEGPAHELEYAGLAVPPILVVNLPGGVVQPVASARVRVSLGEEGSAPRISTTLSTVALPYERR